MLNLALCDDEPEQRAALGELLHTYAALHPELAIKLAVFSSGSQLLAEEDTDFDLYVLDVVMPGLSGIQLGVKLREQNRTAPIIYLSVSPEFALDSYSARAFYYLIKPVQPAQLYQVLDQAAATLEKQKSACITVKTKDGLRLLRLDSILYAELASRTVHYHLSTGEEVVSLTVRGSFRDEIAPLLASPGFILCGSSFAANLYYVTAAEKRFFLMAGGKQVPLARDLAVQARRQWASYWLDGAEEDL